MPFPSLRRRTANEPLSPQEEHKTPSPYRAHSTTVPGLTPRKSLQSLIGSVRKKINTRSVIPEAPRMSVVDQGGSPSPNMQKKVSEEDLYSEYDATNHDHDPVRAGQPSCASDNSKRSYRTPSPHPRMGSAASSLSKWSRLNRDTRASRRSDSSHIEPPKTFLETLADAIRAPTSLFYKENKDKPELDADPLVNNASPAKTLSSKKSVRFKPGMSIVDNQPRSSPIDIPKATPLLPPVQLATTPLLQCFGRDHPDMIPSGRPRDPPVLDSTINFRQAMAEAQQCLTEDGLKGTASSGTPVPKTPTPLLGTSDPMENPFDDPNDERDVEIEQSLLREYDTDLSGKGTDPSLYAAIAIDKQFVPNDEKVRDLSEIDSTDTRMVTAASNLTPECDEPDSSPGQPVPPSEIGLSELFPEIECRPLATTLELKTTKSCFDHYDADSDISDEQPACPIHSFPRRHQVDEKWMVKPTHEDIRHRFKHPADHKTSDSQDTDPASDTNGQPHENTCAKPKIIPLPDALADLSPVQLPESAAGDQSLMDSKKRKRNLRSTSEYDPFAPVTLFRDPPWTAELAFRSDRSSDGTGELLTAMEAAPRPRRIVSCERRTPLPALVPRPLSTCRPARYSYELHTDEYGLCPFDDEADTSGNDLELLPGRHTWCPTRRYSSDLWPKEYGPCLGDSPFDDEAVSPLEDPELFTTKNLSNVDDNAKSCEPTPEMKFEESGIYARSRAATVASKSSTTFSKKSTKGNTDSTDATEAMEEDEAMCKGIV